ncbi:MAG: hypothetical protein K0B11_02365 [Mariniphaga sp.]|nr:hypothetical protein [Mariniphaga sp.]
MNDIRELEIIDLIKKNQEISSKEIFEGLSATNSYVKKPFFYFMNKIT